MTTEMEAVQCRRKQKESMKETERELLYGISSTCKRLFCPRALKKKRAREKEVQRSRRHNEKFFLTSERERGRSEEKNFPSHKRERGGERELTLSLFLMKREKCGSQLKAAMLPTL